MPSLKTIVRFRSALFLTGLIALWGSAAAQTPTQGDAIINSSPTTVVAPVPVTNPSLATGGAMPKNKPATVSELEAAIEEIKKNPAKFDAEVFSSTKKAAEGGDADAEYGLGMDYEYGANVEKNEVEAVRWYMKAADQGNLYAQAMLGACYHNAVGVEKDDAKSAMWYRKAADQGSEIAQFNLGFYYRDGTGVEKNAIEADRLFRMAADQGFADAQVVLGSDYYSGTGVEQNAVEAAKWFRKAADQGNATAQYLLGYCYYGGTGVEKNQVEAVKWFRKAADQGNADALRALGVDTQLSQGANIDAGEAAKSAAEQGDAQAQFELGRKYATGNGAKKDLVDAAGWYLKAAEQGSASAQFELGRCYYNGNGVGKDIVEAAKWFRKAAEQGNNNAQLLLGQIFYMQGLGVIKNEVEGIAWLYVANAHGDKNAAKIIKYYEMHYSESVILQARQRATELQTQITSHTAPADDDSTTANLQPTPPPGAAKASGSGAFISANGFVLTAAHVVQGASRIEVVTATGKLAATVVRIDAANDIALLKCNGSNFVPLPIAPSKDARAGTTVFTLGFPNIQIQGFDPKLTKGEISSQNGFQDDPRQWQISVPIQPGNSGGPLCDENGNLIGIVEATLNSLKMAKIAGEIPQDVNYAVKSSYFLPLLDDVQNPPPPRAFPEGSKFEDVVGNVEKSAVLILVY